MKSILKQFKEMFVAGLLNPENSPAIEQLRRDMVQNEVETRLVKLNDIHGDKFVVAINESMGK